MFTRRVLPISILLALALVMVASLATLAAAEKAGGSVTFRDADAVSDSLVISLSGVDVPATGTKYEGWLLTDGGPNLSVGVLATTPSGSISHTFKSANGTNLLGTYGAFAISVEPSPDPDPDTSGPIAYADSVPQGAYAEAGFLASSWLSNPGGKGISSGLKEQVSLALTHAKAIDSATALADKQQHFHHLINIIEGSAGVNYDASFGDPGDGYGVLNYAADASTHGQSAKDSTTDVTVVAEAQKVVDAAASVNANATRARDNALSALGRSGIDILFTLNAENAVSNLTRASANANTLHTNAQDIASFVLEKGATPVAPQTGDSSVRMYVTMALIVGLVFITGGLVLLRRRQVSTI